MANSIKYNYYIKLLILNKYIIKKIMDNLAD